ncbi:MAG: metal-dependent hydrolase [Bdellovibrionota bacterium]
MFIFGHLGIGSALVRPFSKKLDLRLVLLGTVLPDLIDKPLYYIPSLITGKRGVELGLLSGTRTFGHTLIFFLCIALLAWTRRSKELAALMLGLGTHLFIDGFSDRFIFHAAYKQAEGIKALFWPALGWSFPVFPFTGAKNHLSHVFHPIILWGECAGILLLAWGYWREKYQAKFLRELAGSRPRFIKFKRKRKIN